MASEHDSSAPQAQDPSQLASDTERPDPPDFDTDRPSHPRPLRNARTAFLSNNAPPETVRTDPTPEPTEAAMRQVLSTIGSPALLSIDPDESIEIAPPPYIPPVESRPPGAPDPYIGTTFDHRYKIEELIGEGGMGCVYLARHKVIGKRVAVKILRSDLARDREIVDRFMQEARAASSIGNAHIVDVSDFGDLPDGSTYFVMELLEGSSLAKVIETDKVMTQERLVSVALQITDGLAAAHQRGIVHRDLKPENIVLITRGNEPDFVKILDFGIAKVSSETTNNKLTRAGAVFGTPHYMSPEQCAGSDLDHRADIYSLGVMLYELISGQLPFNAENFMGILTQHMYKEPTPLSALVPKPACSPGLEAIILKCMSKAPQQRYDTMFDLALDLQRLLSGDIPLAASEMQARHTGFEAPSSFFRPRKSKKKGIGSGTHAAAGSGPRSASSVVVLLVAVSAIAASTYWAVSYAVDQARAELQGPRAAQPAPSEASSAVSSALANLAPPAPIKTRAVRLRVVPETAVLLRDGQTLKSPVVEVPEGQTVTVRALAQGFRTETIVLDGKEATKAITLLSLTPPEQSATPTTPARPRKATSAGTPRPRPVDGVVDPWAR